MGVLSWLSRGALNSGLQQGHQALLMTTELRLRQVYEQQVLGVSAKWPHDLCRAADPHTQQGGSGPPVDVDSLRTQKKHQRRLLNCIFFLALSSLESALTMHLI